MDGWTNGFGQMTTPLVSKIYAPKYRTYVSTIKKKAAPRIRKPQDVDLMMVVTGVDEVPPLSSLMHLLAPVDKAGSLHIAATYLVESSIHTTDIIRASLRASQRDIETQDPSLQLLNLVGTMAGAEMETDMLVGNPRQFAQELSRRGKEKALDLCIVPYREGIYFMGESYENFLLDMINKATQMVVILANPAGIHHNVLATATQLRRDVLVFVTGEEDDHEVSD